MNIEKIAYFLEEKGFPKYRLNQIEDWVFKGKVSSFNDIKVLPKDLKEILDKEFRVFSINLKEVLSSCEGDSYKFAFELHDGKIIETSVFRNLAGEWVVCVSSQVGCPVMCVFCASGKKGLKRNLNWEEISDQVLYSRYFLVSKNIGDVRKVVFMGMGEPLMNYENLSKSIKIINEYLDIGKRNISVSTFGYVPRIRDFAKDFPQLNFAFSLHSPSDEKRKKLVPFASKYPLSQIKKALADYIEITDKKIFIEYVVLDGINNKISDAYKIRDFLREIAPFKYFVVNLIPYNPVIAKFKTPEKEMLLKFQNLLISLGIETTIRKSYAKNIKGACGQLALGEK